MIIQKGSRPKFNDEEKNYVQKSAHFRYEIKNQLDEILDSVIYRLRLVSEESRDVLFCN